MIGSTNAGGGGGAGGTLAVSGVAGHTVTAAKDGKTYTRTFNSSGTADFKGLSTGEWSLTMAGGGQTTSSTVAITVDYSVTMKYFAATINITYPSGSTCKATHTDGSELNAPDTSGTWDCVVPKSGTWTIFAEDSEEGKSKSEEVSITEDGQFESVTLNYQVMLFDNGEKYTEATGGWSCSSDASIGTFLYAKTGNNLCWIYTKNKVDVSEYKKIGYQVTEASSTSKCALGLNTAQSWNGARSTAYLSSYETGTRYVDISNITGEYYVGLVCDSYGGVTKCSKVWLE